MAEAENGRAGLEQLARCAPSLILLDLMMPEMDGFEFLEELRKHDEWQAIPIVVLTSKDLNRLEELPTAAPATWRRFFSKGAFSREALLREVRKMVALHTERPTAGEEAPVNQAEPVESLPRAVS